MHPLWLLGLYTIAVCTFKVIWALRVSQFLRQCEFSTLTTITETPSKSSSSANTMRAMVYGRHRVEEAILSPPCSLRKNQVLVQVFCVGLNPVDAKHVLGDKLPHSWTRARDCVKQRFVEGHIIGFDWSGVVMDCPSGTYQPGDAVFGTMPPLQGSLAEYIAAPLDQVALKPRQLSFAETAALPLVGLTSLQSLQPYVHSDTSILVLGGSGGTGHVALSVARALGAANVCAVCSRRNFDFVKRHGATHAIDYQTEDFLHELRTYCDSTLSGHPFDVVFDSVTSADPRDSSHQYPKMLQQANLVSNKYIRLGGETSDWFRAGCERILPIPCFGKEKLFWVRFPNSSGELRQLQEWAEEGLLKPHVHRVVDFAADQVQVALDRILDRRVQGKIVVQVKRDE